MRFAHSRRLQDLPAVFSPVRVWASNCSQAGPPTARKACQSQVLMAADSGSAFGDT
jgi:hypothetical protein